VLGGVYTCLQAWKLQVEATEKKSNNLDKGFKSKRDNEKGNRFSKSTLLENKPGRAVGHQEIQKKTALLL